MIIDYAKDLQAMKARLGLSNSQMSRYLGVPSSTLMSWMAGRRNPSRCAQKLIDVLGMLETLQPRTHELFLPTNETGKRNANKR